MNYYLGGTISRIEGHVGCDHKIIFNKNNFFEDKTATVNSFHNWGIYRSDLAHKFKLLAYCDDESVEAAVCEEFRWLGIMWHPERSFHKVNEKLIRYLFKI